MSPRAADPSHLPTKSESGLPATGRLIAIDWGEKRIGLAISDDSQRLAHPLGTLRRREGRRFPMLQLKSYLDTHQPTGVLVGLPLDESGDEGENAQKAMEAGDLVHAKTSLPVAMWDERMTTARARRAVEDLDGSIRGREGDLDALAATVLLQTYLDSRHA